MIITRDEAFKAVCEIRTPIDNLSYGFCTRCGYEFQKQKDNVTCNFLEVVPKSAYENTIRAGFLFAV